MNCQIALASDDEETIQSFRDIISKEDAWSLIVYQNESELLKGLESYPSLLLLDSRLTNSDTESILNHIESHFALRNFPIIILSERKQNEKFLNFVHLGADEFIRAPFDPSISLARMKSLLRAKGRETKIRSKEKLMRIVAKQLAHDSANPLMVIKGHLFRVQKKQEFIEASIDKISKASDTIEDLLEVSRKLLIADEKMRTISQWVEITPVIKNASNLVEDRLQSKGITLTLPENSDLEQYKINIEPTIFTYSILANLLTNAIKFTERGKQVLISMDYNDSNQELALAVTNEGQSIPEEQAKTINNVHASNQSLLGTEGEKGTGFGLSIAQYYLSMFGGSLFIEAVPQGTKATIRLKAKINENQ